MKRGHQTAKGTGHPEWSAVSELGSEEDEQILQTLLSLLGSRTGHDFRGFNRPLIYRILNRRQGILQVNSLAGYLARLRENPSEVINLSQTLHQARKEFTGPIEHLETYGQKPKNSNEEIMAINEELSALNNQFEERNSELAQLNDDLTNLLSSTDIAVIFLGRDFRIKRFTPVAANLFHLIHSDLGRPLWDLASQLEDKHLVEDTKAVLGSLEACERQVGSESGRWYLRRILPYRTGDERIDGVVITFNEVTELKQMEIQLKASEARFRAAGEAIPFGIWWSDKRGNIEYVSDSYLKLTGKSLEDIRGPGWLATLHDDDREEARKAWIHCVSEIGIWEHEHRVMAADGSHRTVLTRGRPVMDGDDKVIAWVGINLDISNRIAAVNALKKATESAEAANRAKTSFLTSMSHDIRTPLIAILGFSEILSDMLDPDQREIAQHIHEACEHLMGTLDSVLRLTRLEGGKTQVECSTLSLCSHVRKALSLFNPLKADRHISLTFDVPDDDPVLVEVDPDALNRILSNLLGNALKFTQKDGQIQVVVTRTVAGKPEVIVEDDGPGIHPDYIDRIFDAFVQERGKDNVSLGGSGLGLTISSQLADLMGGRIRVESQLGKGTRFIVELKPGITGATKACPGQAIEPSLAEGKKRGRRLIVCDDNSATREVVKLMLPDLLIKFVEDPEELMKIVEGSEVLLLDIEFHGKSIGNSVLKKLRDRQDLDGLRVVAFTAHGLPGQREEFLEAGFDDYLVKPFTRRTLTRAIFGENRPDMEKSE